MASRVTVRLYALLLSAIFLGSGFALPDLDALLYHSSGVSSPANVAHVDPPGGCGVHSEQCALTIAMPVPQLAPSGTALSARTIAPEKPITTPVVAPPSVPRTFLHPSRAPPASAS